MNLSDLVECFGGSLFSEEYRGDFKEYGGPAIAEGNHVPSMTADGYLQQRLIDGIREMLRGRYKVSDECFTVNTLLSPMDIDNKWTARFKYYKRLNLIFRLSPSIIRFRSNFGGSMSTIRECWPGDRRILMEPLPQYATSLEDMCETMVLQSVNSWYIAAWVSASLHPQFAHPGLKAAAEAKISQLENLPKQFIDLLDQANLGPTSRYFRRLQHEVDFNGMQNVPLEARQTLRGLYSSTNDAIGLATYHIIMGDRILSPPFTSPLALNLIVEGHLLGWENEEWDNAEPNFRLKYDSAAEYHYESALELVDGLLAPRLKSAVYLRRACVKHMTGLLAVARGELQRADQLFNDAMALLGKAKSGFDSDFANSQLVCCHELLLQITRGKSLEVQDAAIALGESGVTYGNEVLAQYFGLLMLRHGRRLFLDYARVDLAQICCDCAKACFAALDDQVYLLQACLAEAQLKHISGDFVGAQVIVDTIRKDSPAFNYVKQLVSVQPENAEALGMVIVNLLTGFNRIVSMVYASANDASAMRSWRAHYRQLKIEFNIRNILASHHGLRTLSNSTSPGSRVNLDRMMEETDDASGIADLYNDYIAQAYAALDEADIDSDEGYNTCLKNFLHALSVTRGPEDISLTFQIIAHVGLGDYQKARQILPRAIVKTFSGSAEDCLVPSELREVRFENLSISNEYKIDFNAAERAISLCYLSREWQKGSNVLSHVQKAFPELLKPEGPSMAGADWRFAVYVACLWEHNNQPHDAMRWYLWAFRALQTQRSHVEDPEGRRGMQWSIHVAELFAGLIRLSLLFWQADGRGERTMQPPAWGLMGIDWLSQSLLFAEHSFARTLLELIIAHNLEESAQALEVWSSNLFLVREITNLRSLEQKQAETVVLWEQQYQSAPTATWRQRKAREDLEFGFRKESARLETLRQEIEELQTKLTELESQYTKQELHASLSSASTALLSATQYGVDPVSISTCLPDNAVVIELNTSRGGLIVFGITQRGVEVVRQQNVSDTKLRQIAFPYIKGLREKGTFVSGQDIVDKVELLSQLILDPVHELLERANHVIFVLSSVFMSLPMGTLLYKGRPLSLAKAVSSTPSLAVLHRLRSRPLENAGTSKASMFAVVHTHLQGEVIPSVGLGAMSICRMFDSKPFNAELVDEGLFKQQYRDAAIVHVGTHGLQSTLDPWKSYLSLKTRINFMDLTKLKTNAALVVFCACLSGLGRATNGNDILGFSHAVLQSGAQVYMGSLWKVSELDTMVIMVLFYRQLADRERRLTIAKAWQHAQIAYYNLDKEGMIRIFDDIAADWEHMRDMGVEVDSFMKLGSLWLRENVNKINWDEQVLKFQNPYYWASFVLIGNADSYLPRHEA